MKVVILAGGFGTRLSEYTEYIPKPMVKIGGKPILWHIMEHFSKYMHFDFNIALGYKSEVIKEFFINYKALNSDFRIDLGNGNIFYHSDNFKKWKVNLINTGLTTMTGGRVKRIKQHLNNETFLQSELEDSVDNAESDGHGIDDSALIANDSPYIEDLFL